MLEWFCGTKCLIWCMTQRIFFTTALATLLFVAVASPAFWTAFWSIWSCLSMPLPNLEPNLFSFFLLGSSHHYRFSTHPGTSLHWIIVLGSLWYICPYWTSYLLSSSLKMWGISPGVPCEFMVLSMLWVIDLDLPPPRIRGLLLILHHRWHQGQGYDCRGACKCPDTEGQQRPPRNGCDRPAIDWRCIYVYLATSFMALSLTLIFLRLERVIRLLRCSLRHL